MLDKQVKEQIQGAGQTNQPANSIVINSSGTAVNGASTSSFYVRPINTHAASAALSMLLYDTTTFEVCRSTAATSAQNKTFVIKHPLFKDKYLVHACLEGPEAGVYYRGQDEITNGNDIVITLPEYVFELATDFTIQVTQIFEGKFVQLATSKIENNRFKVFSNNGNTKFYWIIYGKRENINVEPYIIESRLKGNGPYTWIE